MHTLFEVQFQDADNNVSSYMIRAENADAATLIGKEKFNDSCDRQLYPTMLHFATYAA